MKHFSKGKLLSKAPCNDDLFEGGAHRKLAKEISDEIRNDDNCTIIGIDGGWGSGKSNLVGMIQKELSEGSNGSKYHFFFLHMMLGDIKQIFSEGQFWKN